MNVWCKILDRVTATESNLSIGRIHARQKKTGAISRARGEFARYWQPKSGSGYKLLALLHACPLVFIGAVVCSSVAQLGAMLCLMTGGSLGSFFFLTNEPKLIICANFSLIFSIALFHRKYRGEHTQSLFATAVKDTAILQLASLCAAILLQLTAKHTQQTNTPLLIEEGILLSCFSLVYLRYSNYQAVEKVFCFSLLGYTLSLCFNFGVLPHFAPDTSRAC
ncbi:hypothetical protein NEDG_01392 [Nematocida displodere]|uniref:Uncharacterized protein n=1 Tax=Nematocida displodere TaxID=1805483 RepID=A0A177EE98_9MICR|nr:hypothetical protein NEDG_01392 [Nematocida displodere]